ncbi:2Fe-2S iron-sulfur cluster-binding protein [Novosphingobium album (ex Liu et al. 2023)]|uniref:2Fe-2S iron-sulfur cluster-binding protein n=1 Tax=Novosphingobium album (ex Liu et al. 2023) TaxID=3031130 RepID=A0ABT5WX72_9SPHN|nr:2Fe-2S iron-sulfur cluster-binding protein [Novosphingobium album (ex Liu et al. 2023)]MDE8654504.1 2Fe-2S iron-sulfur cluster-binding protein [Novosphingobium album (ex Liu et al. 2023)]
MARITYIEFNGTAHQVEVEPGTSVMRGAVDNGIPGIDGDCGGGCACATCHVYVDAGWMQLLGQRAEIEEDLLGFAQDVRPQSRLSCQIEVTPELDGLVVTMPETQS